MPEAAVCGKGPVWCSEKRREGLLCVCGWLQKRPLTYSLSREKHLLSSLWRDSDIKTTLRSKTFHVGNLAT